MRDDPLNNLNIVKSVQKYPILYDSKIESRSSKVQIDQAWTAVGKEVDMQGKLFFFSRFYPQWHLLSKLPGTAVRDRWRIIRGSFVRYLRQSACSSGPPLKEYYMAKYMQFLTPHLRNAVQLNRADKRRNKSRKVSLAEESDSSSVEIEEGNTKDLDTMMTLDEAEEPQPVQQEGGQTEQATASFYVDLSESDKKMKRFAPEPVRYTIQDVKDGSLIATPQEHSTMYEAKTSRIDEESNPDLMFLKSLLPDMASLSNRKKNKFKVQIITALDDLLDD